MAKSPYPAIGSATTGAAKGQETKLKNDTAMAVQWLVAFESV